MTFVVDPRVIDLRREFHLWATANKATQGDRCNRANEMGKREAEIKLDVSMMSQKLREGAQKESGTRITEGALNGKFSGKSRLKWNVPPLYGLSD